MNFYECQEFFKQMYPDKKITFEFDEKCHRQIEIICTDGNPNMVHHIECNKVKVTVFGMAPIYVPIQPHRYNTSWVILKEMVNKKNDVFIHERDIEALQKEEDKEGVLKRLIEYTGLTKEQILKKLPKM